MVIVACGWRHTISVSSSGRLYTYGWSKYGQLGHGDFEDQLVPHKLEALGDSCISQVISHSLVDPIVVFLVIFALKSSYHTLFWILALRFEPIVLFLKVFSLVTYLKPN